jgi:putative NIF3 family GTP cyclohydrolase 1 type 2
MTAQQTIDQIKAKLASLNIAWRATTVDTFKAGSPETEVRGIATTGMATFDLLKRASAAGCNFVIAHEPTFYNHQDQTTAFESDPVYLAKQKFIKDNSMIVFRFHDHAHMLQPDPLVIGSARALGLTPYAQANPRNYVIPETTLRQLARTLADRVGGKAIRVAGDPDMKVTRITLGPGSGVPALNDTYDVSIGGETNEAGGNAVYAADAAANGRPRGVILLGHMMSEDWGMREVADWMKTFITGVPVEWIPAGEPFSG